MTWAPNVAVSNPFNPFEGYPNQSKIGDYITIVSDDTGGNVAYSATFNFNPNRGQHEEDVYYVRVFPGGQAPTPTPTPTATPTLHQQHHSYTYSHANRNSLLRRYSNTNGYSYAKTYTNAKDAPTPRGHHAETEA